MKTQFKLAILLQLLCALCRPSIAQGSLSGSFTYQGVLKIAGSPANGLYDFQFSLFSDAVATNTQIDTTLSVSGLGVTNGLFTTILSFPQFNQSFNGADRFLEIAARPSLVGSNFVKLSPRSQITATPYAITAGGVVAGGITGVMLANGAVTSDKILSGAIKSSQIDDGGNLTYQNFLSATATVGGDSAIAFTEVAPVQTTNGGSASLQFTVGGSALGTVLGFTGAEKISQPYAYVVQVQASGGALNPAAQLGLSAQLTFTRNGRMTRFGGIVTACSLAASNAVSLSYLFKLEPALATMELGTDYKIYQTQTAPAVAATTYLRDTSNTLSQSLSASYPAHDNLIQYGETDLNFFSRILEYEGIFFLFDQSASPPSLALGDNPSAYLTAPNSPFGYYGNASTNPPTETEYIRTFQKTFHQSTLASVVSSYNFLTSSNLQTASVTGASGVSSNFEFGASSVQTVAYNQLIAQARQDRQTTERNMSAGSSTVADLRAGYTFTLSDHTSAGVGGSYVITSVRHAGFVRVTNGVSTLFYGNQFEAVPASLTFRPPMITPKPHAETGSAVVCGPAGEEIHTDAYGRIKVQFRWDRSGNNDQNSSGWIRVASPWAGKNFGVVFLPRIGNEVVVSFLQGDPDQPVITGSLYNANNMPPWELPANQTQSGVLTRSSKAGTYGTANALRFEDKKGSEQLWIHAEKNMDFETENDVTFWAGHDYTETIDHDFSSHVKHDKTLTVDNNLSETVHANYNLRVDNNLSLSVGAKLPIFAPGGVSINTNNPSNAALSVLGTTLFSGNLFFTDPTASLTFPPSAGANAPMMYLFASGTGNSDRMVFAHSSAFPSWGLQYQDSPDKFHFLSGGSPVLTVDLGNRRVGIGVDSPAALFQVGNATCNGTTWANASDRNSKENFQSVDAREILDKVLALPLSRWNYKADASQQHVGPMAQDFYAAFNVGPDDKHITTVDEGGVALAAIQGLNQKLEAQRAENAELKRQVAELTQLFKKMEARR